MIALLGLFVDILAPTFLSAGAGFFLGRWLKITPRVFSQVIFYIFSPCLVFNLLLENRIAGEEILQIAGLAIVLTTLCGLAAWLLARVLRLERRLAAAVVLASAFTNAGNLGMPVAFFAFGETAMAYASIYFIVMSLLTNTAGVVIASMGTTTLRRALLGLLKVPTVYALALALLLTALGVELPLPLQRTTTLLGDGAIPSMLVLLGLQFNHARWSGQGRALTAVAVTRLLLSPVLAFALGGWFGLQNTARQASILQSAMPTAVLTTVLATEFDIEPSFISVTVVTTTLISALTITPVLALLGA